MSYTCPYSKCHPTPFQKSNAWFRHCVSQRHVSLHTWHELNRTEDHSRWVELAAQTHHDQKFAAWLAGNLAERERFDAAREKARGACNQVVRPLAPEGAISDEMEFGFFQAGPGPTVRELEPQRNSDSDTELLDFDFGSLAQGDVDTDMDLNLPADPASRPELDDDKYWQPSPWFKPNKSDPFVHHPDTDNPWFPWPSEVFFLLYTLVHGSGTTVSEKALNTFWYILKKVAKPEVSIPSLHTVKRFQENLPKPRIYRHETKEAEPTPYHQISLCDQIRMQMAIPSTGRELKEHALIDIVTHSRGDLWTGSKWKLTPQLQKPFVTITASESKSKEVWFGEVIKVRLDYGNSGSTGDIYQWGVFRTHYQARAAYDQEQSMTVIRFDPLIEVRPGVLGMKSYHDQEDHDLNASHQGHKVQECLSDCIQGSFSAVQHSVTDVLRQVLVMQLNDGGNLEPFADAEFDRLFGEHPVRRNRRRVGELTPIRVVNVSLWQDDLAGNRSKKWNPHTSTTARLAGIRNSEVMMLSVAKDINGTFLWTGVAEELKRLMRGILAYDASLNQTVLVTGGLVQVTADNPAHSDICCHAWKSDFPCRMCQYNPKDYAANPSGVLTIGKVRSARECQLYLEGGIDAFGIRIKTIVPDLHDLDGFNAYHDTPWERLHSWLLGPLKEVNKALISWSAIKSLKGDIKLFVDALNWDGFDSAIAGRRVTQWLASFVGKDHRDFSQLVPLIMNHFLRPENTGIDVSKFGGINNVSVTLELLALLGTMTVMLYMHVIPDIRLWRQQWQSSCQRLVELLAVWHTSPVPTDSNATLPKAAINVHAKPKFHLLTHVPEYIESFGCTRNSMTEHEEHLNSTVRNWLVFSNRQAPSLDTARRFASADGLLFILRGGVWCDSDRHHGTMTTAGRLVLEAVMKDKELREMAGFSSTSAEGLGMNTGSGPGPFHSYQRLQCRDLATETERRYFIGHGAEVLHSYQKACLSDGTTLQINSFFSTNTDSSTIFRVTGILSLTASASDKRTYRQNSEYQWWIVGRRLEACLIDSEATVMGCSVLKEVRGECGLMVFNGDDIQLQYNLQHFCDKNCGPALEERGLRIEREFRSGTIWKHSDSGIFVVNRFKVKSG